ncbi:CLUMA_CG001364, isoform A [Clunio marinus]|uniref:CLUMA_CG001364, isoform A n=1 Tax=Clunio marinus TaxID=568069 RepID=A0A1J1HHQ9_9DIPT|nr:CLUMA_CG001364, isoform A [Clunio marinus]
MSKECAKTTLNNYLTHLVHLLYLIEFDNVEACLNILRQHSVPGTDSITANDIIGGRLKAVLSLFFGLSKYRQLKAPSVRPQSQIYQSTSEMMLTKESFMLKNIRLAPKNRLNNKTTSLHNHNVNGCFMSPSYEANDCHQRKKERRTANDECSSSQKASYDSLARNASHSQARAKPKNWLTKPKILKCNQDS